MNKKKWILSGIGLLLVILGALVFFMRGRQSDLRDFSWGMTREQVKQHESALLESEKDDALIYRTTLFESLVAQGYYFTNGKLSKVQYVSLSKQKELKSSEYLKIRAELEHRYGPAAETPHDEYREIFWNTSQTRITLLFYPEQAVWVLQYQP